MPDPFTTVITGTGSFIPADIKTNQDFTEQDFYDDRQQKITGPPAEIVRKLELVTGIVARRYAGKTINTSDMAAMAAAKAIADAGIDPETLDQVIVAHNFGDVSTGSIQSDAVPSLASRVKHILGIQNPFCTAYDILFGCPGWIQGLIQADAFIKSGLAKRCLVIGAEALSRVIDKYDRDSMIFSDGAGAVVVEAGLATSGSGILGFASQSFTTNEIEYINMAKSYAPDADASVKYMKMLGRKVYEFALKHVPVAMKLCLEKSNVDIADLKKIFIHQANAKMDAAIVKAFYQLYNTDIPPENVMPMNIRDLGNNSVATIPVLFDMVRKGLLPDQEVNKGDIVLFASVGAGMNINAICYRF